MIGLASLGFLSRFFWWLLAVELVSYASILGYGCFDVAKKAGWKCSLTAPLVFVILHFGYGLGSLWGIVRWVLLRGRGMAKPEECRLTR